MTTELFWFWEPSIKINSWQTEIVKQNNNTKIKYICKYIYAYNFVVEKMLKSYNIGRNHKLKYQFDYMFLTYSHMKNILISVY